MLGLMDRIGRDVTVDIDGNTSGVGIGSKDGNKVVKSEYSSVIDMLEEGQLLNEVAAQKQSGAFATTPTDTDDSVGSSDDEGSLVGSLSEDKIGKTVIKFCVIYVDLMHVS